MSATAAQIFELLLSGGWSAIERMVADRRAESLHLDFKQKRDPQARQFHRDDKRNLAEALSGFANSDGGVLVWGVDARRLDDVDAAAAIVPITELDVAVSELIQLTPEMVSPAVAGVQHSPIRDAQGSNRGVVLTYVPQSDATPHMARGPNMHRYYRRTSASFRPLEHYEVADLFGRRAHPEIRLRTEWAPRISSTSGGSAVAQIEIFFIIENVGRGLARYPALSIGRLSGYKASSWTGQHGGAVPLPIVPAPQRWWLRYAGGADKVIYPDDEFRAANIAFEVSSRLKKFADFSVEYQAIAADTEAITGLLSVPAADVERRCWELFAARGFDPRE